MGSPPRQTDFHDVTHFIRRRERERQLRSRIAHAGRLVRELASGTREAGQHTEGWNLRDASGRTVGAGLYFARLETDGRTLVRRVAVTR